ncbi:hypothetical protein FQN50_008679 [Emmonsiellopsis sp. PD_5]|nr:hypothetical protein FQN50_008679 [Emmonsiellopsis sp. PD_5]
MSQGSQLKIPHWRHVYRGLLREACYLPDPVARQYMSYLVRQRYRAYWKRVIPESFIGPHGQFYLERRGRKYLSLLTRANEGHARPLERILMLSYGRSGLRRQFLARQLILPDSPVPKNIKTIVRDMLPPQIPKKWEPIPALLALVKSQSEHKALVTERIAPAMQDPEPPVPRKNVWDAPISPGKAIRGRQKWYRMLTQNLLAPIPHKEFDTLCGLLSGTEPWSLPKRRTRPAGDTDNTKQALDAEFLVFGPEKDLTFDKYKHGRPHIITRKFMSNFWERVLLATPRLTWDAAKSVWTVRWGKPVREAPIYRTLDPEVESSLFDGVDGVTGALPQKPPTPNPKQVS